jgi:hypothetical protein
MNDKELIEFKRRYHGFRHHAWAGLGFLSVVLALRLIFFDEAGLLTPIIIVLAIYIIIALIFTYRYRAGLSYQEKTVKIERIETSKDDIKKEELKAELEKERLKLEKKRIKAESKATKKGKMK